MSVLFFFFSFPELKMCETFQSKVSSPKDIHFAGLFWLLIFYLINEILQYVVSNGHFILTFSLHSGGFKFFLSQIRKSLLSDELFFCIFCSARNVKNQLFTQFYLSEGLGQVSSYFTLPFQLFSNICKFPLALWLSDRLVCQTLAA